MDDFAEDLFEVPTEKRLQKMTRNQKKEIRNEEY
jgi:hypothetical protein